MHRSLKKNPVDVGYSVVRGWRALGLPLLSGKVFMDDFVIWRRKVIGLTPASRRPDQNLHSPKAKIPL
jgi:hypothetical protein